MSGRPAKRRSSPGFVSFVGGDHPPAGALGQRYGLGIAELPGPGVADYVEHHEDRSVRPGIERRCGDGVDVLAPCRANVRAVGKDLACRDATDNQAPYRYGVSTHGDGQNTGDRSKRSAADRVSVRRDITGPGADGL